MAAAAKPGRRYKKGTSGNPKGRPKGTTNVVPRAFKTALERVFHELAEKHETEIRDAILNGITARAPRSFPYLQLLAHYVVGKPTERHEITGGEGQPLMPTQVIHEVVLRDDTKR
jgi:hypothetical protein